MAVHRRIRSQRCKWVAIFGFAVAAAATLLWLPELVRYGLRIATPLRIVAGLAVSVLVMLPVLIIVAEIAFRMPTWM